LFLGVCSIDVSRNTRDRERVRLRRELADFRQRDIRVLAGLPVELSSECQAYGVAGEQLNRSLTLRRFIKPEEVMPDQPNGSEDSVHGPNEKSGPDV
jgi:hypothetical protein